MTRMGRTHSDEQAAKRTEQRLRALHGQLRTGVAKLVEGEDWRRWLDTAVKFPEYSARNVFLILAQRPDATQVAGYTTWQQLGRQVRKGEKGIEILAAVSHGREPNSARPAHVFDISQTDGPPLPERPQPVLVTGSAPAGLWERLEQVATDHGWSVKRAQVEGLSNGYADFDQQTIVVQEDLDGAHAVKTLAHEVGHVVLHDASAYAHRGIAEVEAESVAYLVVRAHGIDPAEFTFPYIAGWVGDDPLRHVEATADRVLRAANVIMGSPARGVNAEQAHHLQARADDQRRQLGALVEEAELTAEVAGRRSTIEYVTDSPELFTARPQLERHARANEAASEFFRDRLDRSPEAKNYLEERLGAPIPPGFVVGYAPTGWTQLLDHLRDAGFADRDLVDAGLVRQTARGTLVDVFRDRVVFAMHDEDGRIAGFVGRPPHNRFDDRTPKYMNTSATPLFDKGRLLFGLHEQSAALRAGVTPVLLEGPMDVLSLAVADDGRGAVAPVAASGTAVTPEHIAAIQRSSSSQRLVLAGDGDTAGRAAMVRAAELAVRTAKHVDAAILPVGSDPAQWVAEHPEDALGPFVDRDRLRPAVQLIVDERIDSFGDRLRWIDGRVDALRYAAKALDGLPVDVVAEEGARIAERLDLDPRTVGHEIADASKSVRVARSRIAERAARLDELDADQQLSARPSAVGLACMAHPGSRSGPARPADLPRPMHSGKARSDIELER